MKMKRKNEAILLKNNSISIPFLFQNSDYYLNVRSGKPEADKNIIKDKTLRFNLVSGNGSSFCRVQYSERR